MALPRESMLSPHLAALNENYTPPEFPGLISLLSVGRPTASGSPSLIYCEKRNTQGSICYPRKLWKASRSQMIQNVLVKVNRRTPTVGSTLHTGVIEARTNPACTPYHLQVVRPR